MDTREKVRKWSELYHAKITIPSEGRQVATLEDFYYEPDSSLIKAFLVRDRLQQEHILPNGYILAVEQNTITIPNANVIVERRPDLPTGHKLLNLSIVSESGEEVGTVGEILIGTIPTTAIRIVAITLSNYRSGLLGGPKYLTANNIVNYNQDQVVIFDQVAKQLS